MNVNVYSSGKATLLHIRFMGCNRRPYRVNVGSMLRNSYIIHYVTRGRGYYNGNAVEEGQGFLITPGNMEEYHADPDNPWELLWVVSEDEAMKPIFETYDADPKTGIFSYDYVGAVQRAGDSMLMLPQRVVGCTELLELFLSIYKHHDHPSAHGSEHLQTKNYVDFALHYIHLNYQNAISIRELTELLGVSQPYLFRIFKAETGKSPKQYLRDYRLLQAKKLLRETSLTISQVAASVGYADALAFSKFFAQGQGISPRKFRQQSADSEP